MHKTDALMQKYGYNKDVSDTCYSKKMNSDFEFVILVDRSKKTLSSYIKLTEAIIRIDKEEEYNEMVQNIKTDVSNIMEELSCIQ